MANFHQETVKALGELVAAAGLAHPRELSPRHFLRRIAPDRIVTFADIYKFLEPGELLSGKISDARMRTAWTMA